MRHGTSGRAFSRTSSHKQAMLASVVTSLLRHERIKTTAPKAKEARRIAERVITLGKKGTLHARRMANKTVRDDDVLRKVFDGLAERYAKRAGGYTRMIRIGQRRGDAAEMVLLELVDRTIAPAEGEAPEADEAEEKPTKAAAAKGEPKAKKAPKAEAEPKKAAAKKAPKKKSE